MLVHQRVCSGRSGICPEQRFRTVPNLSCGLVMKEQQQWRLRTVQPQTPSPGWDQQISRGLVTLLTTRIFEEPSLQTQQVWSLGPSLLSIDSIGSIMFYLNSRKRMCSSTAGTCPSASGAFMAIHSATNWEAWRCLPRGRVIRWPGDEIHSYHMLWYPLVN